MMLIKQPTNGKKKTKKQKTSNNVELGFLTSLWPKSILISNCVPIIPKCSSSLFHFVEVHWSLGKNWVNLSGLNYVTHRFIILLQKLFLKTLKMLKVEKKITNLYLRATV